MKHVNETTLKEWQVCYYITVDGKVSDYIYDPDGLDINYFPCWDTEDEAFWSTATIVDINQPMAGFEIVETLREYLVKNPEIRFTQALYNLDINQFANKENPGTEKHQLRDPYNDSNKVVLERVKKRLEK
jgi:hypothetical protein